MDEIEHKRAKEREKKKKQREKLKENQGKYAETKKRDAERKKFEREQFKENVKKHPRKYLACVEKNKELNATRVKRFREKNRALDDNDSLTPIHPQTTRRNRETKRSLMADKREKETEKRQANRRRVQNYRLRIRLSTPSSNMKLPSPVQTADSPASYKHRSSESRAYKRVTETLPQTPAKKVRIIEKIVRNTTPKSRSILTQSPSMQAIFITPPSRRKLNNDLSALIYVKTSVSEMTRKKTKHATAILASKLLKKSRKISSTARIFGISRKALAKHVKTEGNSVRKERCDKIPKDQLSLIHNFYLEKASRAMPNKRDVLLMKDENGNKVPIQKHIMEMTQQEAFKKFKAENPTVKVNKRKFDNLRPAHVRRTNVSNRIVCCCTYCENIRLKVQALNKAGKQPFKSTWDVLEDTLCNKNGPHHKPCCIKRECENCGTNKLKKLELSQE